MIIMLFLISIACGVLGWACHKPELNIVANILVGGLYAASATSLIFGITLFFLGGS